MSYSKQVQGYPAEFWAIAELFAVRADRPLTVPFQHRREAVAWRGRFNAFKSLVAQLPLEQAPMPPEHRAALIALRVRLQPSMPTSEEKLRREEPAQLLIEHADHDEASKAIKAALARTAAEGGSPHYIADSVKYTSVGPEYPYQQLEKAKVIELPVREAEPSPDAMESLLEREYGAKAEEIVMHCEACQPQWPCWAGLAECTKDVEL